MLFIRFVQEYLLSIQAKYVDNGQKSFNGREGGGRSGNE